MQLFFSVRSLRATALLVAGGLASCSRGPEASVAAPASAPTQAAALAPVPAPARPEPGAAERSSPSAAEVPARPPARLAAPVAPEITVATAPAAPKLVVVAPGRVATYTQAGRVLDESGQPLVGATVLLRGSTHGTSTDATGGYLLEVPKGENTFVIGYAGYENETASSHDGQPLTVTLLPVPATSSRPLAKDRRGHR